MSIPTDARNASGFSGGDETPHSADTQQKGTPRRPFLLRAQRLGYDSL